MHLVKKKQQIFSLCTNFRVEPRVADQSVNEVVRAFYWSVVRAAHWSVVRAAHWSVVRAAHWSVSFLVKEM